MESENSKSSLTAPDKWARIVLMACFALAGWVVLVILTVMILMQTLIVLVTGSGNDKLQSGGKLFTDYLQQIIMYMIFATDDRPWPFAPFPDPAPAEEEAQTTAAEKVHSPNPAAAPPAAAPEKASGGPETPEIPVYTARVASPNTGKADRDNSQSGTSKQP